MSGTHYYCSESSIILERALSNVIAPANHNCFRKLHYCGKNFEQCDGPGKSQLLQKAPLLWKELWAMWWPRTNHNCFRKLHYVGKSFEQCDVPDESQLLQKAPLFAKDMPPTNVMSGTCDSSGHIWVKALSVNNKHASTRMGSGEKRFVTRTHKLQV